MSDVKDCSPTVYLVHHKPLSPRWEQFLCPIRVGNYDDMPDGMLSDNTGENIAAKNKSYAELTALYWIWKNDKASSHIGLWHYRRWMLPCADDYKPHTLDNIIYYKYVDWLKLGAGGSKLTENDILQACMQNDVILPYSAQVLVGDIEKQFLTYHPPGLLDAVYNAFDKLYPDYPSLRDFMRSTDKDVYGNMMIARRDLVDNYCSFLFPLLTEVRKDPYLDIYLRGQDPDQTNLIYGFNPRWAGFWGERLLTYYATNFWLNDASIKVDRWHVLWFDGNPAENNCHTPEAVRAFLK